ncbi:tissue factor pathway inhibitor isoform X4 [Taeniopygia guttata]|uniref:tissue factor pathway inhibitor isoform X4 n=1 Tax=Taeniopygia guttata TaxID=59729 RepID=UPI003BB88806
MVKGKMKGRKEGHFLPSPFILLLFCIAGRTTAELDGSKEEHAVGAGLPPLKLVHSFCAMKADDGPCKAIHIRYFFNIKSRKCEVFEYGGCHGNENNFLTLEECQEKCVAKEFPQKMALTKIKKGQPDFCFHAQEPGVCRGYFTRYFYNKETKLCEAFKYGGCLGNQNNFRSLEECQTTCQDSSNLLPAEEHPSTVSSSSPAEEHPSTVNSSSPAEEHPSTVNSSSPAEEHPSTLNSSSPAEEHPSAVNSSSPAEEPSQSPEIFVNLLPAAPNEKSNTLNSSSAQEEPNQFPIFFESRRELFNNSQKNEVVKWKHLGEKLKNRYNSSIFCSITFIDTALGTGAEQRQLTCCNVLVTEFTHCLTGFHIVLPKDMLGMTQGMFSAYLKEVKSFNDQYIEINL